VEPINANDCLYLKVANLLDDDVTNDVVVVEKPPKPPVIFPTPSSIMELRRLWTSLSTYHCPPQ
jgi:hypothetical protein